MPSAQARVRNRDPLRTAIGIGAVATVALGDGRRRIHVFSLVLRPVRRRRAEHLPCAQRNRLGRRSVSSVSALHDVLVFSVFRRTTAAAGESRCSCLPAGRPRSCTTGTTPGSARRPSRRAIPSTRRRTSSSRVSSTSRISGAFRILRPPAPEGRGPATSVRPACNETFPHQWRGCPIRARAVEVGSEGGLTGRQSGAAPVRVGSPAESNTSSWCAASRWASPVAVDGHQEKRPRERRLWQS